MKIFISKSGKIVLYHGSTTYDLQSLRPTQLPPALQTRAHVIEIRRALVDWAERWLDLQMKWTAATIEIAVVTAALKTGRMLYWDAAENYASAMQRTGGKQPKFDIPEAHGLVDSWLEKINRALADPNKPEQFTINELDP